MPRLPSAVDPLRARRRAPAPERLDQRLGALLDHEHLAVLGGDEALGHGVVEERGELGVVAAHVEQPERLGVQPELRPGVDLEQLLERAHPARERDEPVRELGHQRLALVHRADDPQVGSPRWAISRSTSACGITPTTSPPRVEHGVGDHAHQPDVRAAVDEPEALAAASARPSSSAACDVVGMRAGARAGEDAQCAPSTAGSLSSPPMPTTAPPDDLQGLRHPRPVRRADRRRRRRADRARVRARARRPARQARARAADRARAATCA